MDLADIRKKANLQKNQPVGESWEPEPQSPLVQDGEVAVPWDDTPGSMPDPPTAVAVRTFKAIIDDYFDHPFQIDSIEGNASLDVVRKDQDEKTSCLQWLTFSLCGEEYAIDINSVNEIIKPREITEIPRVPDFILGIISLRGIIVPIYDLARRLKLGSVTIDQQSRVIVCQIDDRMIGLLVDSITQVARINEKKIEAPPAVLADIDRDFVAGVGRYQGRMLILLKLNNVLNPETA